MMNTQKDTYNITISFLFDLKHRVHRPQRRKEGEWHRSGRLAADFGLSRKIFLADILADFLRESSEAAADLTGQGDVKRATTAVRKQTHTQTDRIAPQSSIQTDKHS